MARAGVLLAILVLLGGCATAFPPAALEDVNRGATVAALRQDPSAYVGQRVVLGGEILATRTQPGLTELELLTRPLRSDDSPERTDVSEGRVLVRTTQFLDPAVFAQGRRVTVVGRVTGGEERTIGDMPYRHPVIASEQIRLWGQDVPVAVYPYVQWGFGWYPYGYRVRPYWYGGPYPYWWW